MNDSQKKRVIFIVGFLTFFFGFGGPAILNLYLISIHSPLVLQFRSSLNYTSAILGDGIIFPIVNMFVAYFLARNQILINIVIVSLSFVFGFIITSYFHIVQAVEGLVNWSMPTPWQWNFLGFWHATYMFSVASLISLFYILLIFAFKNNRKPIRGALFVSFCLILFFILLRLDYSV